MHRDALDELCEELAALETAERRISAERRRLLQQIDFGFSTGETLAREREVSDERRRLHQRIDSLRKLIHGESASRRRLADRATGRNDAEITRADGCGADELEQ